MRPPAKQPESVADALRLIYGPIAGEMDAVEALFAEHMRAAATEVDEMVRYGALMGGKRLRPALLLLSGQALGPLRGEHVTLAAVVEMIHTATLIHDDVLDEATMRRHLATVPARWGNQLSVLLGDYLFSQAFWLASTTGSADACRVIGDATRRVCEGEMRQVANRANFMLSESDYYDIIAGKTGELCAVSCRLGGMMSGADAAAVEALADFGRRLGMAFQIADDLLDLLGAEKATGKTLGTDLLNQKLTLPLIRLRDTLPEHEHARFDRMLQEPDKADNGELLRMLHEHDGVEYARAEARRMVREAVGCLEKLPPSDSRDALRLAAEFSICRVA